MVENENGPPREAGRGRKDSLTWARGMHATARLEEGWATTSRRACRRSSELWSSGPISFVSMVQEHKTTRRWAGRLYWIPGSQPEITRKGARRVARRATRTSCRSRGWSSWRNHSVRAGGLSITGPVAQASW